MCNPKSILLAALCTVLFSIELQALPDDREQDIRITSDQALRDEKQGFTVYSGNVRMNQGSLHLQADKITIYRIEEEADRIVAEGKPARMRQQPEIESGPVNAEAGVIEYYKLEDRIHLRQSAQIEQDGSIVAGETIDYFITDQLVKANSDKAEASSRVEVIIPAAALPSEDK